MVIVWEAKNGILIVIRGMIEGKSRGSQDEHCEIKQIIEFSCKDLKKFQFLHRHTQLREPHREYILKRCGRTRHTHNMHQVGEEILT